MSLMFEQLKLRIAEIETGLGLNKTIDLLELSKYQELTKAYIVLCHAELEKYFEMLSLQIVYDSKNFYGNDIIKKPLLSLVSCKLFETSEPKSYGDNNNIRNNTLLDRINRNYTIWVARVKENNGIKNKDVCKLFWPLGIEESDIGTNLLLLLDGFGSSRGRIAHTGMTINQTILNINDEKNKINSIINELALFDSYIESQNYLSSSTTLSKLEATLY